MEDVYTIKVKTKPDTRNIYPSERRYSASTVSGLAWVHIALAATSFLLACLALVNPNEDLQKKSNYTKLNISENMHLNVTEIPEQNTILFLENSTETTNSITLENSTESLNENDFITDKVSEKNADVKSKTESTERDNNYIVVLAPTLLTIFALAAGIASVMASVRWYIDKNIVWLLIMSILSTIFSFVSLTMIVVWFMTSSDDDITEFYKDKVPFTDFIVVRHKDVIEKNSSHMIIKNAGLDQTDTSHLFTKRVLAINILIACFLELLWSILSVKIAYKGMRNNYKDNTVERRGNCVSVVTKIKGNNMKKMQRNGKFIPPKPDLIEHYPNSKIKRLYLAQNDNGYYLKTDHGKAKNTETSSEFYKERMNNFLNRCASLEGISNPEIHSEAEPTLNVIPEISKESLAQQDPEETTRTPELNRMTPQSWGDTLDHTIYNQNTLNLDSIFKFVKKEDVKTEKDKDLE